MAKNTQKNFVIDFNRLVGTPTGRPISNRRGPRRTRGVDTRRHTQARVRYGTSRVPSSARRAYEAEIGTPSRRRTNEQMFNESLDRVISAQDSLAEQNARVQEAYEDAYNSGDNFSTSAIGRVLDVISRPAFAVNEAIRNSAESRNEGASFLEQIGAFAPGALAGITGQAKTGFGDVIEELAEEGSQSVIASPLQALAESHPDANKWVRRGLGLTGDLLADPLNAITGGSVAVARQGGGRLTTEAVQELAEAAARRSVSNVDLPAGRVGSRSGGGFVDNATRIIDDAGAAARTAVDRAALEITGGPNRGKLQLGRGTFAPTVGNAVAANVRAGRLSTFEKHFNRFMDHVELGPTQPAKRLSPAQLRQMKRDPLFAKFLDESVVSAYNSTRPTRAVSSADEVLTAMTDDIANGRLKATTGTSFFQDAARTVRSSIDEDIARVYDDTVKELTGFYYNAPSIRIAGHDAVLRPVGRAWSKVSDAVRANPAVGDGLNRISYSSQFPGRMANIGQTVRSVGLREFENAKKQIRTIAKTVSRDDAKRIQAALETGIRTGDQALDDAADQLRELYRRMGEQELALGIRKADTLGGDIIPNYAYTYMRGGSRKARERFKTARKKAIRDFKEIPDEFTTAGAKAKGLRPVENAFEAATLRVAKHQRDMARARFLRDLIDHYGFVGAKIGKSQAEKLDLVELPLSRIGDDIVEAVGRDNHIYIPDAINDVYKHWEALAKLDNSELNVMFRALHNITNKFKTIVTLPFPGFHLRNMVFDFFMGTMDGVKFRTYSEVIDKFARRKHGAGFKITDDITLTWDEAWDLFRSNASSGGFYSVDIAQNVGTRAAAKVVDKARDISEFREDFGRFVHFIHALRDEAQRLSKRGGRPVRSSATRRWNAKPGKQFANQGLIDKAVEAAIYRVNHYKFDYGAVTKLERQGLKLAFPFYTFARKSIPMLIESLFTSPRLLSRTYRFMESANEDRGDSGFNSLLVPPWLREIGYAKLTEEEEPWLLGGDVMPTAPLTTFDLSDTSDFTNSVLSQANPFANLVYENATQRRLFDGGDPGTLTDQVMNLLAPYTAVRKLSNPDQSIMEKILGNRLLTGSSIRKLSDEQQQFSLNELEDTAIDDPFREFNYSQDQYRIYKSSNGSFRVKNLASNEVLFTTNDPAKAIEFARNL